MSRAGTLRCWTICAAVFLAGALPAHAQVPDSSVATPAPAVVGTDIGHVLIRPAGKKKHSHAYDDVQAVTELTAALAKVVEPALVFAPEPLAAADATLWTVPVVGPTSASRAASAATGRRRALAGAVARELAGDSTRKARPVLGSPVPNAPAHWRSGSGVTASTANTAAVTDAPSGSAAAAAPGAAPATTSGTAEATAAASTSAAGMPAPATPPPTSAPTAGTTVSPPAPVAAATAAGVPADSPTAGPLTVAMAGARTAGAAAAASSPAANPEAAPVLGSAPATPANGGANPAATTPANNANAAGAAPAAPAVLGTPVNGFEPDATRVAAAAAANAPANFMRAQLASARVIRARGMADAALRSAFQQAGVPYPGAAVYLRAFKREHELEVWGRKGDGSYALVKTLSICSLGGSGLGPKLHRGDEQVPEGFYHVVEFNPTSEYHLSLRLDYPNAADRARKGADDLGGDIYLHGGCKSAGCLPLTDTGIELVYWLAVQARFAGQQHMPIDIFPARMDASHWAQLSQAFAKKPDLLAFWSDLKAGYDAFEQTHRLPDIAIDASGRYRIALAAH